jgi:hypothetical protein
MRKGTWETRVEYGRQLHRQSAISQSVDTVYGRQIFAKQFGGFATRRIREKVAGGRSEAKTTGSRVDTLSTLEGCENSGTPSACEII